MSQEIKLLLVDDHPVFRQGLCDVLETDPQMTVVGESADGEVAIETAYELRPDVILMDINLPTINGLQVTRKIKAQLPETAVRKRPILGIIYALFHNKPQTCLIISKI